MIQVRVWIIGRKMKFNARCGVEETYKCSETGVYFYIWRINKRENGHEKRLYCYKCQKKHNFIKL